MIFFVVLLSVCFSFVIKIGDIAFDEQDFYIKYSKQEWENSSDAQKEKILKDYIKRESASISAKLLGFEHDPGIIKKTSAIKKQLLVNFFYDESVGLKTVSKNDLLLSKRNLGIEVSVHHLLIGFKGSPLKEFNNRDSVEARVLIHSLSDSLNNNLDLFSSFVEKYSDDPGKLSNAGSLGWLSWGRTPMAFQGPVWGLEKNILSKPILSPLGYHLAWIDSSRYSGFAEYDSSSYNYFALQSLFGIYREKLKENSLGFDDAFFKDPTFSFYKEDLLGLLALIEKERSALREGERFNLLDFFQTIEERFVVCSIGEYYYGLNWLLLDLELGSRQPTINSVADLIAFFKPLILQKNAFRGALGMGLDKKEYFLKRFEIEKNRILYDKYLKFLVNSIETPSQDEIKNYYTANLENKYSSKEKVVIRQIRVEDSSLADSLYFLLLETPDLFVALAENHSLVNPSGGGLVDAFEAGKYNYVGQRAFELNVGEFSEKIKNPDKTFSIILLEEKIPPTPIPLKKVQKRIESLLIKRGQDSIKESTFNGFYNNKELSIGEKYSIYIN